MSSTGRWTVASRGWTAPLAPPPRLWGFYGQLLFRRQALHEHGARYGGLAPSPGRRTHTERGRGEGETTRESPLGYSLARRPHPQALTHPVAPLHAASRNSGNGAGGASGCGQRPGRRGLRSGATVAVRSNRWPHTGQRSGCCGPCCAQYGCQSSTGGGASGACPSSWRHCASVSRLAGAYSP
jgi:hypothetical protein